MSDWNVGDLAIHDPDLPYCIDCEGDDSFQEIDDAGGGVETVAAVYMFPEEELPGIVFCSDPPWVLPWCSCQYRKIRPDKHENCEPEFVHLLKRSKVAA